MRRVYPVEFIVLLSCSHKVIIGWNSLSALHALIDCSRGEVLFSEFPSSEDSLPSDKGRFCWDDCIFPPDSAVVITVQATKPRQDAVIFEPDRNTLLQKGIALTRSLIPLNEGKADISAVNVTTSPQFLPRGMCVAFIETPDLHSRKLESGSQSSEGSVQVSFTQDCNQQNVRAMLEPSLMEFEK